MREENGKNAPKPKNPVHLLGALQLFRDDVKAFETPLLEVDSLSAERRAGTFAFPRFPLLIKQPGSTAAAAAASRK